MKCSCGLTKIAVPLLRTIAYDCPRCDAIQPKEEGPQAEVEERGEWVQLYTDPEGLDRLRQNRWVVLWTFPPKSNSCPISMKQALLQRRTRNTFALKETEYCQEDWYEGHGPPPDGDVERIDEVPF